MSEDLGQGLGGHFGETNSAALDFGKTNSVEAGGWLDAVGDPELKAWAKNKNYPSVDAALSSHRGLEKLLGSEKLPMPKDPADQAGWERVYKALGRPDAPSGYGLDQIEGADPEFARTASEWMHRAGVGERQARSLAMAYAGWTAERAEAEAAECDRVSQAEMVSLRREWGDRFDAETENARRAARVLDVDADAMAALESALGTGRFLKMFATIGGHFAEDRFVGGDGEGSRGFSMSPADARARIKALMTDKAWAGAYLEGDANKRAEMERLNRLAAEG
jgi:hypothetical protein